MTPGGARFALAAALLAAACVLGACGSSHPSSSDDETPSNPMMTTTTPPPSDDHMAVPTGGQAAPPDTMDAASSMPPPRDYQTDPREMMPDAGGGTIDAAEPALTAYYRITALQLRDPRFYLTGTDITDTPFLGTSVNGSLIPGGLTMDYDGDGFLDVSIVVALPALDPESPTGSVELMDAHCQLNAPTACVPHPSPGLQATWATENHATGACLEEIGATASAFELAPELPQGPCFTSTQGQDVVMNVSGIRLDLTAAQVSASYEGSGPDRLVHGLIRGFLSVPAATSAVLPDYLVLLAGAPLSDFLDADERDMADSPDGTDGWWVYLSFTAEPVSYTP